MNDEVFGPILPVLAYESLDDAIGFVNDRPHPLAFYPFGRDRSEIDRLVRGVAAGMVTVNHTVQHASVADLPFGGVGASGMGVLGGEHGFRTLSQSKPVVRRALRPGACSPGGHHMPHRAAATTAASTESTDIFPANSACRSATKLM